MDDTGHGIRSLKRRLRKTICCCFSSSGKSSSTAIIGYQSAPTTPTFRRAELPELKHRCRSLISRIGANNHRRRRSHSTEFHYDPLSYSLNFEEPDDADAQFDDHLPLRSFTARLPRSPVRLTTRLSAPAAPQISAVQALADFPRPQRTTSDGAVEISISREITACS